MNVSDNLDQHFNYKTNLKCIINNGQTNRFAPSCLEGKIFAAGAMDGIIILLIKGRKRCLINNATYWEGEGGCTFCNGSSATQSEMIGT